MSTWDAHSDAVTNTEGHMCVIVPSESNNKHRKSAVILSVTGYSCPLHKDTGIMA